MRIEGISPYDNRVTPVSTQADTVNVNSATTSSKTTEDFDAILKKCVSVLSENVSQNPSNTLAEILGYDEEMINDLLQTSDGKQKLAQMAENHLTDVVISGGNDDNKDTVKELTQSLKEANEQKMSVQELQDTFESLASIYNRTIKPSTETTE